MAGPERFGLTPGGRGALQRRRHHAFEQIIEQHSAALIDLDTQSMGVNHHAARLLEQAMRLSDPDTMITFNVVTDSPLPYRKEVCTVAEITKFIQAYVTPQTWSKWVLDSDTYEYLASRSTMRTFILYRPTQKELANAA